MPSRQQAPAFAGEHRPAGIAALHEQVASPIAAQGDYRDQKCRQDKLNHNGSDQ
jgi:hypothetical protein